METRSKAGDVVVVLRGDIDLTNAEQIDTYTEAAIKAEVRRLTFDLSAVEFMDSQGLYALLRASEALRANGADIRLRAPSPAAALVLEVTAIDARLPVES